MKYSLRHAAALVAVLGLAALYGCAGSATNSTPATPGSSLPFAMQLRGIDSLVQPDACSRIRSVFLDVAGGHMPVPECNGTDGRITYGANNAGENTFWQVESYKVNPNPHDCGNQRGKRLWLFETVYLSAEQAVFQDTKHESFFYNPNFPRSATFTLYEYFVGHKSELKLGSPNQDMKLPFPSPFNGKTVQGQVNLCFELASS